MNGCNIVILCHGGQSNSLLARALHLCGVKFGNRRTRWEDAWYENSMENFAVTRNMLNVGNCDKNRPKTLERRALRDFRTILRKYKREAREEGWEYWCIKTTSGICPNKWPSMHPILTTELPNAIYLGLLRKPPASASFDNWLSTVEARLDIVRRLGGVFFPFPEIFTERLSELKGFFVNCLGLDWNPEIEKIYDPKRHLHLTNAITVNFLKEAYDEIMEKSAQNIVKLRERPHQ